MHEYVYMTWFIKLVTCYATFDLMVMLILVFSISYLSCPFLGEANGIRISKGSVFSAAFVRMSAKGNESRIGKLKSMASNMALMKESQSLRVNCSLRQFAVPYPQNVHVDREYTEFLGIRKSMDVRANQTNSLCR